MASRQNKAKSTFQVPDYSKTRVYTGSLDALGEVGFATVAEFVSAVNDRLVAAGHLPISCGDYPTSEKKLRRLIKRWSTLRPQSQAA